MPAPLVVEGTLHLSGPFGPVVIEGRGEELKARLDRFPPGKLEAGDRRHVGTLHSHLTAAGLKCHVEVAGFRIASLGHGVESLLLGRILGTGPVKVHPLNYLRARMRLRGRGTTQVVTPGGENGGRIVE